MKKMDWILVAVVLILFGISFFIYLNFGNKSAGFVQVTVDGKLFGTYPIKKERDIVINDTNHLIISGGQVDMIEADCADQICVEHKTISKNKEAIVCLPNKVVVEIVGGEDAQVDAVANQEAVLKAKVAYFGVFTALGLIFSYVESLIPIHVGIPGVKLGLANLIVVIALYKMKIKEVYVLSVVRIVLVGFVFGNLFAILYSLAGGMLSLTMMCILKKTDKFSVFGVSIAGGVFHNIGQLMMAMIVLESISIGYYFPILLVSGLITGFVIGFVSNEMMKRLKIS